MIRIDEIYNNIFLPKIVSKSNQSMHYFHPFGSTSICDLKSLPVIYNQRKKLFLFWDQEPLYLDIHKKTIDSIANIFINVTTDVHCPPKLNITLPFDNIKPIPGKFSSIPKTHTESIIITSEKNSKNVDTICNKYGLSSTYYFFHGWAALDWFRGYNRTFLIPEYKDRNITNTFISPNRIVSGKRNHRTELLKLLVKNKAINNNKISFPLICPYSNQKVTIPNVELPLVFENEEANNIPNESYKISLWNQSKNSLLYVITETVYNEETLHLTEKTFKPIVMQMPFILVGTKHSLEYLRSYGFKTFGEFWNEDYDNQSNNERLVSIAKLLKELDNLSFKEKQQLQKYTTPIVEHNFNWFYSNNFEKLLWKELTSIIKQW